VGERSAVGNAGDAEQVGRAKRSQKFQRDVELDDLRAVLSIPAGRRLAWRVLTHCSAFASVFAVDPTTMAHNAGRQDVGHWLMHEIEVAKPDAFLTMMQEHAPKQKDETPKEPDE
jgi:hypothetical protein